MAQNFTSAWLTFWLTFRLESIFESARVFAFNRKYGNYDYSLDLRSAKKEWSLPIKKLINNYKSDNSAIELLDIGGNTGIEIQDILDNAKKYNVTVLDLSEEALNIGRSNFPQFTFMQQNMEHDYGYRAQFDICLCLRAIQSRGVYRNDVLIQIRKYLKPNGLVIVSIPNGYLNESGKEVKGLYDHRSKVFTTDRPFVLANKIRSKLEDYGFCGINVQSADAEIIIWATKG